MTTDRYQRGLDRMMELVSPEHGVPAKDLLEVIGVSTGRSWMSDNLIDVQYDLLLKDVGLLVGELGSLSAVDLGDEVEQEILHVRSLLGRDSPKRVSRKQDAGCTYDPPLAVARRGAM